MAHSSFTPLSELHAHPRDLNLPYSRPATPGVNDQLHVGWVGLGAMGHHMAANLAKNPPHAPRVSLPIKVWNRSREKAEKLQKDVGESKIVIAASLAEIARTCDIVIVSLSSDEAVKSVHTEFANALKDHPPAKNKIFVETSTIYPTLAGELDKIISSIPHCHFITSPVFGPPAAAETGKLLIYLSGDYQSKKAVAHLLVPAVGRKVTDLGGNVEKAPTFKLIGNSMIIGAMEIISEAYTIGTKSGIDQAIVYDYIKDMFPAPSYLNYGSKMLNNQFDGTTGFAIDGGIKDASHIRRLTAQTDSPMPLVDVAYQHLLSARALHAAQVRRGEAEYPVLDWSALIAGTRVAAGLDGLHKEEPSGVVKDD